MCHTSIRWYIRRFRPRLRVSVTVESCGTIAVSLRGSKVHPEEPLRLIGNQYSQRATTARFQWCSTTDSPSNRPLSIQGCRRTEVRWLGKGRCSTFPKSHSEPVSNKRLLMVRRVFYQRGARSALTSRVVRIRRAGSSPVRQPAGDKRIYHQLLGSVRPWFTIGKVSLAAFMG